MARQTTSFEELSAFLHITVDERIDTTRAKEAIERFVAGLLTYDDNATLLEVVSKQFLNLIQEAGSSPRELACNQEKLLQWYMIQLQVSLLYVPSMHIEAFKKEYRDQHLVHLPPPPPPMPPVSQVVEKLSKEQQECVQLVASQVDCSELEIIAALIKAKWDFVQAIMDLTI